jgi:hypothetical protein
VIGQGQLWSGPGLSVRTESEIQFELAREWPVVAQRVRRAWLAHGDWPDCQHGAGSTKGEATSVAAASLAGGFLVDGGCKPA